MIMKKRPGGRAGLTSVSMGRLRRLLAMDSSVSLLYKTQAPGVAYEKAVLLLDTHCEKTRNGITTFKETRSVLAWLYHLNRSEIRRFLHELHELGLIELVPCWGLRLKSNGRSG